MLEIRLTCEQCNKKLPFNSKEAMICTFECTFCSHCPNCGGNFSPRPIRPKKLLKKYPVSKTVIYKPKNV